MTTKTKEKDIAMTEEGDLVDKETGEVVGQLMLFDGHQVHVIENVVKGGEVVIFGDDGRYKKPLKFGDKIKITATAEVVKVAHSRDKDDVLVRVQTLVINMMDFNGFAGGVIG